MTFPTTTVLDAFSRAAENPLSDGGLWSSSSFVGTGRLFKTNGTAALSSQSDGAYVGQAWATGFTLPVECYYTISSFVTSHSYILYAIQSPTNTTRSGYAVAFASPGNTWTLSRYDSGVATTITSGTFTLLSGDQIGMSVAAGGLITVYANTGSGWMSLGSTTDTTYQATTYLAMGTNSATAQFDSFGGGQTVNPNPTIQIMQWNGTAYATANVTLWVGPNQPTGMAAGDIWRQTTS